MGRRRAPPRPVTAGKKSSRASGGRKEEIETIQRFHSALAQLKSGANAGAKQGKSEQKNATVADPREELRQLGGIDAYQKASMAGAARPRSGTGRNFSSALATAGGFSASKWALGVLQRLGWYGFYPSGKQSSGSSAPVTNDQDAAKDSDSKKRSRAGEKAGSEKAERDDEASEGDDSDHSDVGDAGGRKKKRRRVSEVSEDSEDQRVIFAEGKDTGAQRPAKGQAKEKVRMLDVGALENFLGRHPRVACTAIDLHPQHASVRKIDFFDFVREFRGLPLLGPASDLYAGLDLSSASSSDDDADDTPASPALPGDARFDVVLLSLVLNFVPDRQARGRMLAQATHLLRSDGRGSLLVVLPKACVENSRYFDHDRLVTLCHALRFRLVESKVSERGKLAFFVFLYEPDRATRPETFARAVVNDGKARNNFAIWLDQEALDDTAWANTTAAARRQKKR
jgi:25S rRNA (adenine(2142)-N(1))-methyltransferase, Bmt2